VQLVLRRGESWDGWFAAVWEGRGGMWKKKGKKKEKQRKRGRESVHKGSIYWRLPTDSPTEYSIGQSVVDFTGGSDTSLLGYPGLNPSVYSVGKFVWIKSTSSRRCNFQKKFHAVGDAAGIYRQNYSVGIYRWNPRWKNSVSKFQQNWRRN